MNMEMSTRWLLMLLLFDDASKTDKKSTKRPISPSFPHSKDTFIQTDLYEICRQPWYIVGRNQRIRTCDHVQLLLSNIISAGIA